MIMCASCLAIAQVGATSDTWWTSWGSGAAPLLVSLVVALTALFGVMRSSERQARSIIDAESVRHLNALAHSEEVALRAARASAATTLVDACVALRETADQALWLARVMSKPSSHELTDGYIAEIATRYTQATERFTAARFQAGVYTGDSLVEIADRLEAACRTAVEEGRGTTVTHDIDVARAEGKRLSRAALDELIPAARSVLGVDAGTKG